MLCTKFELRRLNGTFLEKCYIVHVWAEFPNSVGHGNGRSLNEMSGGRDEKKGDPLLRSRSGGGWRGLKTKNIRLRCRRRSVSRELRTLCCKTLQSELVSGRKSEMEVVWGISPGAEHLLCTSNSNVTTTTWAITLSKSWFWIPSCHRNYTPGVSSSS